MNKHTANHPNRNIEARETLEARQQQLLARAASRQRAMLGAWVGATAIALVATITLLESCGQDSTSTRPASYQKESTVTPQQNAVASADRLQATADGVLVAEPARSTDAASVVPPDVVVAASDTFVTAGQPIEVTVEGTPDVTEMALSDGRGDALPMVRDSSGNLWRVHYRVPLRPRADRVGLAVTAKNAANRWRRVWLFLQVDDGKQEAAPDTTGVADPEPR